MLVSVAALLSGCRPTPVSYVAPVPSVAGDAYACALRMVNQLDYTVTNTNRESGFIQAEKHRAGTMEWLLARDDVDRLTVSIFEDTVPRQNTLRVTASAGRTYQSDGGTRLSSISPSANAKAAAQKLATTCTAAR
jgi:hypothetical protein